MYIPFISSSSSSESSPFSSLRRSSILRDRSSRLERRKGGGGHASSGGKGSSSSSSSKGSSGTKSSGSSSSSSSTSKSRTSSVAISGLSSSTNGRSSATAYGSGGGSVSSIPSGQLFAGRNVGGGSRSQVYGTSVYGSGYYYPYGAAAERGVEKQGFPFYFWPVVWGGSAGAASGAYLHDEDEYGSPDNTSRPGGPMTSAFFISNSSTTSSGNISTFHILTDNSTLISLIASIQANCSLYYNSSLSSTVPITYNPPTNDTSSPQPEQAIQYYRASSVVLTLDGYNNTEAWSNDENVNATQSSLPSNVDNVLLECLNATIGEAVPLVDAAVPSLRTPIGSGSLLGLVWLGVWAMKMWL